MGIGGVEGREGPSEGNADLGGPVGFKTADEGFSPAFTVIFGGAEAGFDAILVELGGEVPVALGFPVAGTGFTPEGFGVDELPASDCFPFASSFCGFVAFVVVAFGDAAFDAAFGPDSSPFFGTTDDGADLGGAKLFGVAIELMCVLEQSQLPNWPCSQESLLVVETRESDKSKNLGTSLLYFIETE